jgi:hypothetical protein
MQADRGGEMAGYLPFGWSENRVRVVFGSERGGSNIEATVVGDSEGGLTVEVAREEEQAEERVRRAFIPWYAVRYVELLEEPDEDPGIQIGPAW